MHGFKYMVTFVVIYFLGRLYTDWMHPDDDESYKILVSLVGALVASTVLYFNFGWNQKKPKGK